MLAIDKIVDKLSRLSNIIGILILTLIAVFIVVNIVLRYVFNNAVSGSVEVVEVFLAVAIFLGFAYTTRIHGHIAADFVTGILPRRVQTVIELIVTMLSVFAAGMIGYAILSVASGPGAASEVTMMLDIPTQPFRLICAFGMVLVVFELVLQCIKLAIAVFKNEEPQL